MENISKVELFNAIEKAFNEVYSLNAENLKIKNVNEEFLNYKIHLIDHVEEKEKDSEWLELMEFSKDNLKEEGFYWWCFKWEMDWILFEDINGVFWEQENYKRDTKILKFLLNCFWETLKVELNVKK